jgi:hypothetical protein
MKYWEIIADKLGKAGCLPKAWQARLWQFATERDSGSQHE